MRKLYESYSDPSILQAMLARIPWWHNILLLEKLSNEQERMWYAQQTIINEQLSPIFSEFHIAKR